MFVATAAHAVPQRPQGRISFISAREAKLEETTPQILAYGSRVPDRPDVAFLELSPEFVTELLKKEPITLARVSPCGAGLEQRMVYLFGYPSELSETHMITPNRGHILFCGQCYCHPPIMPDDWEFVEQSTDLRHRPDPMMDVFLPYLIGEEMCHFEENPAPDLRAPKGLSGGGLWQLVDGEETIWAPEMYHLMAIQSRWPRHGRHLQATQIMHWLRLVYSECPDLRSALEGRFPEQSFA